MRSSALRDPVPGGGPRRRSTPSPRRWRTSRAPRSSTACSTPAPAGSPTPRPGTRRRWSSHADGQTSFLPLTPRPPLGSLPGRSTTVSRARARAGRDAGAVLQRRGRRHRPGARRTALDRLADVARDVVAAAPGALDADASAGLAAAIAEGVPPPEGWPDDVAVLVAHRRGRRPASRSSWTCRPCPAALPGRPPPAGRLAGRARHGRAGPGRRHGRGRGGLRERRRARLPRAPSPGRCTVTRARRRRRRAHGDRARRGHLAAAGPRPRRPRPRPADHAAARRRASPSRSERRHHGDPEPPAAAQPGRRTPTRPRPRPARRSRVDRTGARPVVPVSGAVDELGAEQLRIRLLEASHGGTGRVELDLGGVSLFSSAAVRVVLGHRPHRPGRGLAAGRPRPRGRA